MRTTWTFHSAGQILFGRHAVRQVGEVVQRLQGKRVFIVADPILIRLGMLDQVSEPLKAADLTIEAFTEGEPEPAIPTTMKCVGQARAFRPDVLIGLGGGSNMDLAKIAATLLAHSIPFRNIWGDDRIPGPILPLICIPTTAGTGSEVSGAAVVTDSDNHIKVGILSNWLRPRVALVDPMLTVSSPPKVTADSGIDALTHAIEGHTAVDNESFPLPVGERSIYQGKHPMGDLVAEKAISLIGKYLVRAVKDGSDLEAREGMALGALLGGLAFSNVGVALVHALEYPVGGAVHISHGAGNGLLLPYVMRFNLPTRPREFAAIAKLLGEDVSGLSPTHAAERAIDAVVKLRAAIGIPNRLREIGVRGDQLDGFAAKTFAIKRLLRVNPRSATQEDLRRILEEAY
ncbi:MAG: iron-containing alcohol dehydrogenase [Gemmataceae bacterium]|nr:iron-containing alcohol dehydrogenase [Gemmataceae bacterium]